MKGVRWFFFELLILGYVEDPATGLSFHSPAGLSWALYIEVQYGAILMAYITVTEVLCSQQVPSRATQEKPARLLEHFKEEVPALALLGTPVYIDPKCDYCIDHDVQLVCKYLRAYENHKIDSLYGSQGKTSKIVISHNYGAYILFKFCFVGDIRIKFSTDPRLSEAECKRLLQKYMSDHVKESKITQKLFIQ